MVKDLDAFTLNFAFVFLASIMVKDLDGLTQIFLSQTMIG